MTVADVVRGIKSENFKVTVWDNENQYNFDTKRQTLDVVLNEDYMSRDVWDVGIWDGRITIWTTNLWLPSRA